MHSEGPVVRGQLHQHPPQAHPRPLSSEALGWAACVTALQVAHVHANLGEPRKASMSLHRWETEARRGMGLPKSPTSPRQSWDENSGVRNSLPSQNCRTPTLEGNCAKDPMRKTLPSTEQMPNAW